MKDQSFELTEYVVPFHKDISQSICVNSGYRSALKSFVSETADDLKIFVITRDHEQLLKCLRALESKRSIKLSLSSHVKEPQNPVLLPGWILLKKEFQSPETLAAE